MGLLQNPITTDEGLEEALSERLKSEREADAKKYEGWTSPEDLKKIQDGHAAELKKQQDAAAKAAEYKTELTKTRIALEAGLPAKYASRITGDDEKAWKEDAKELAKDFAAAKRSAPIGNPEPSDAGNGRATARAYKDMVAALCNN